MHTDVNAQLPSGIRYLVFLTVQGKDFSPSVGTETGKGQWVGGERVG